MSQNGNYCDMGLIGPYQLKMLIFLFAKKKKMNCAFPSDAPVAFSGWYSNDICAINTIQSPAPYLVCNVTCIFIAGKKKVRKIDRLCVPKEALPFKSIGKVLLCVSVGRLSYYLSRLNCEELPEL